MSWPDTLEAWKSHSVGVLGGFYGSAVDRQGAGGMECSCMLKPQLTWTCWTEHATAWPALTLCNYTTFLHSSARQERKQIKPRWSEKCAFSGDLCCKPAPTPAAAAAQPLKHR